MLTSQLEFDGSRPSQISSFTNLPAAKPVAITVNDWGLPAASAGTVNGAVGLVIVPAANATPAAPRTTAGIPARASSLRTPVRTVVLLVVTGPTPCPPIHARRSVARQSRAALFASRSDPVHQGSAEAIPARRGPLACCTHERPVACYSHVRQLMTWHRDPVDCSALGTVVKPAALIAPVISTEKFLPVNGSVPCWA